ncbi:hypothetical protein JCM8208_001156 [Rhodotorula glutinis]
MSGTLTLVTSDDPPVRLEASRLVLAAGSKVFADMFELPQLQARQTEAAGGIEEGCVVLAEPEKVVLALIAMFEGKAVGELEAKTWEALARAGDKYDSPVVKQFIERRIWCGRSGLFPARRSLQLIVTNFKARRKAALLDALASASSSIAYTGWTCRGSCKASYCDPYKSIITLYLAAARYTRAGSTRGPFADAYTELESLTCYRRQARDVFEAAQRHWTSSVPSFRDTY